VNGGAFWELRSGCSERRLDDGRRLALFRVQMVAGRCRSEFCEALEGASLKSFRAPLDSRKVVHDRVAVLRRHGLSIALGFVGLCALGVSLMCMGSAWGATLLRLGLLGVVVGLISATAGASARFGRTVQCVVTVVAAAVASVAFVVVGFFVWVIDESNQHRYQQERLKRELLDYPLPGGARVLRVSGTQGGGSSICFVGAVLELETSLSARDLNAHYAAILDPNVYRHLGTESAEAGLSVEKPEANVAVIEFFARTATCF